MMDVTNTGNRAGADVIQLYVGCEESKVDRPKKVLRDFERVELEPGETKKVELSVSKENMAYFSEKDDDFVTEDIDYIAYVGDSSKDQNLQKLKFRFK